MAKDAVFTMKLESELHDKIMEEAAKAHRPASQVVRELMREFVHKKEEEREYDKWFRAEVEEGIREADDPSAIFYTQEEMETTRRDAFIAWFSKTKRDEG